MIANNVGGVASTVWQCVSIEVDGATKVLAAIDGRTTTTLIITTIAVIVVIVIVTVVRE